MSARTISRAAIAATTALTLHFGAAHADLISIGTSGSWTASEETEKGSCWVGTVFSDSGSSIDIIADAKTPGVMVYNKNWHLSPGPITLDVKIDGNDSWTGQATVSEHSVIGRFPLEVMREFVHQFTAGTTMQLSFNGELWRQVSLTGTTAIWGPFMDCATRRVPQVVASITGQMPSVAVAPTAAPSSALARNEVQMASTPSGLYALRAELNGKLLTFELDSGASGVVIPLYIAKELAAEGKLTFEDFIANSSSTLANGTEVKTTIVRLRSVTVGGVTVENVKGTVGDDKTSLLLGQAFLRKFKSWSIDNERHVLVLGAPA